MKQKLSGFFVIMVFFPVFAQVPQSINYQTIVRNHSGQPVADQTVSLKFSILLGGVSGPVVYAEKHVKPTNQFGIINLHIGKGTVISGQFSDIDWGAGRMFLNTRLDVSGGDNFTEMGTTEMVSVPYALFAGSIHVHYSNDTLYIGDKSVYLPRGNGNGGQVGDKVTDYNGNVYGTVTIGSQTWLAESLRSTHYADGTPIEGVYDYEDNASISASYGKLYTWEAAMRGAAATESSPSGVQGVCPAGYHLPSFDEWKVLADYVISHYEAPMHEAGMKLKGPGTTYWNTNNGTNETGFSARGAGRIEVDPNFISKELKEHASFWSTSHFSYNTVQARRFLVNDDGGVSAGASLHKSNAISVRCIKN